MKIRKGEDMKKNDFKYADIILLILVLLFSTQALILLKASEIEIFLSQALMLHLILLPALLILTKSGVNLLKERLNTKYRGFLFILYYVLIFGIVFLLKTIFYPSVNFSIDFLFEDHLYSFFILLMFGLIIFSISIVYRYRKNEFNNKWIVLLHFFLLLIVFSLDKYSFGLFLSLVKYHGNRYVDITIYFWNLIFIFIYIVLPLYIFILEDGFSHEDIKLKFSFNKDDYLSIILLPFFILLLFLVVSSIYTQTIILPLDFIDIEKWFIKIVYSFFFLAFSGELIFRGVLISYIEKYFPKISSISIILISSILFSLTGLKNGIQSTTWMFILGILLSYIFIKRKNLILCCFLSGISHLIADEWDILLESLNWKFI